MIKLYNHSAVDDKAIRDVLTWAACKIGVRGDVYVKVTGNRRTPHGYTGYASNGWVKLGYMRNQWHGHWGTAYSQGPQGWIEVALHASYAKAAKWELDYARSFLELSLHEMSHVRDYREGVSQGSPRTASGRRIAHDKRPCEVRAENRVYDVMSDKRNKKRTEELILNLAIAIEVMA